MNTRFDLKKEYSDLYRPRPQHPAIVEAPAFSFLMIDGRGDPNVAVEYQQAVAALFSLAYALKFQVKKTRGVDYAVMPLEGLWWAEDMNQFSLERKGDWLWTMMICQPEWVDAGMVASVLAATMRKKDLPALEKIRFETFEEGLCVQLLHIGPYSAEGPNIARLHAFAAEHGYRLRGKHHEIYLSDVTRSAPEKLRTILRQPVEL